MCKILALLQNFHALNACRHNVDEEGAMMMLIEKVLFIHWRRYRHEVFVPGKCNIKGYRQWNSCGRCPRDGDDHVLWNAWSTKYLYQENAALAKAYKKSMDDGIAGADATEMVMIMYNGAKEAASSAAQPSRWQVVNSNSDEEWKASTYTS